ncbi:outer membrane protein assembly factor BamD [Lujinxingia sediminis]|uniref:Outer membrane protein assembly factor BamD n=2 Tax=Lujinxingia sediminis TaxID=2480984 RepID=A0ABY0CPZ9_9DELT|nr:outer membrane protein assembly factor BamD [Lujinxingia sediminis]
MIGAPPMLRRILSQPPLIARLLALGLLTTAPLGCASAPEQQQELSYSDQAEAYFQAGEQRFERRDYLEAMRLYNTVRNQFPYSRWAALAHLRIADAYFEQDQNASAVEQYRAFIQLYPRHESVEYAHWRIALSFHEQMPSDFFVLPPAYERDLSSTRDAVREMRIFLQRYENSEYAPEARRLMREAQRRLADYEFYVATYYLERDNPRAAAGRLTHLLRNFAGLGLDPEALFLLGKAYLQLDEPGRALTAWTDLIEVHPQHPRAAQARKLLQERGLHQGDDAPQEQGG